MGQHTEEVLLEIGYDWEQLAQLKEYLQKALELTGRISDRERYLIQGDFYSQTEKTYDKAIEAYSNLLRLYPENFLGNVNFGGLYSSLEEWDKAIERYEVNFKLSKQTKIELPFATRGLSYSYMAKGLYDKAEEVLEYYLNNFSENALVLSALTSCHLYQGNYNIAFREADKLISLNARSGYMIKGDIYQCKGDLINAEKEYQNLLKMRELSAHLYGRDRLGALYLLQGIFSKSKEQVKKGIELAKKLSSAGWERDSHFDLSYLNLKSKNPQAALEECEEAWKSAVEDESLGSQRSVLYWKGYSYLEMKSMNEAQRMADELKSLYEKALNKKIIRRYYHLMGMIELKREKFPLAIEYFKKAIDLMPFQRSADRNHAIFHDSLALAYLKAGNIEKAREEYENIISLTVGRLYAGDIYAKSFYMLGKIHEQQNDKVKAIEHYEKFLTLWKDADPGIAEVEDARKRLAWLRRQ